MIRREIKRGEAHRLRSNPTASGDHWPLFAFLQRSCGCDHRCCSSNYILFASTVLPPCSDHTESTFSASSTHSRSTFRQAFERRH